MAEGNLKSRRVDDYGYFMTYQTRWNDNDQYAHLNNSVYNLLFDTIINKYLIEKCNLNPSSASTSPSSSTDHDAIALVIESHATFIRALSFPSRLLLGVRVLHVGKSSVRYEVGVFGPLKRDESSTDTTPGEWKKSIEVNTPAVVGGFTHVFVNRQTRKPIAGMSTGLRKGLMGILVEDSQSAKTKL